MKTRITLNTFRKLDRQAEIMIRAAMPRTSESDAVAVPVLGAPAFGEVIGRRNGFGLVRPLTFTMREVTR